MIPRVRAALPALQHRDFALLFSGQAISVVGDALFPVALAFAVLELLLRDLSGFERRPAATTT